MAPADGRWVGVWELGLVQLDLCTKLPHLHHGLERAGLT